MFIREQHAIRAETLPFVTWESEDGNRALIENSDYRQKFGSIIGQIAASHWWNYDKLEKTFGGKRIPAPPPYSSEWSIDLLKLACILRTADAANIDERRAPGFLFALRRSELSDFSRKHWVFQNKLTQAQCRGDSLVFASTTAFERDEADSWWLLFDTLKMIDRELRAADELLTRYGSTSSRFAATRVANLDSPTSLSVLVPTKNWKPLDTAFSIEDIPKLIENLGGKELYGNNSFVALREIIQNAMDATRLRAKIDSTSHVFVVEVELNKKDDLYEIMIRDAGVGMSTFEVINYLLSFGASGWLLDKAIGEYNDEFPNKGSFSGKYGIGFFSIFMLGKSVKVTTRRFDRAPDETIVVKFDRGLHGRPILYTAEGNERLLTGGTTITVDLDNIAVSDLRGTRWLGSEELVAALGRTFPTSDIALSVRTERGQFSVNGKDWATEPAEKLLSRICGDKDLFERIQPYVKAIRQVIDQNDQVLGRACLLPEKVINEFRRDGVGVVTTKGATACFGAFGGAMVGTPTRASRDGADFAAGPEVLRSWAADQAKILAPMLDDEQQVGVAQYVAAFGADPADLKVCTLGSNHLSLFELGELLRQRNEIWVAQDAAVNVAYRDRDGNQPYIRNDGLISVDMGTPAILYYSSWRPGSNWFNSAKTLEEFVLNVIQEVFEIGHDVMEEYHSVEDGHAVYISSAPAWRSKDGGDLSVRARYYCRRMSREKIDEYFEDVAIRTYDP